METMHTPGPWELDTNGERQVFQAGTDVMIAEIPDTAEGLEGSDATADANAKLIASAPELLKTLEQIRDMRDRMADGDESPLPFATCFDDWAADIASEAIAKAKGE